MRRRNVVAPAELEAAVELFRRMADAAPVMMWMSGTDTLSTYFNQPWLDFTGRTLDQELGVGWSEVLHPDDVERCLSTYRAAFAARRAFELECRQLRRDGQYRWVLGRGKPMHAPNGEFIGYVGTCIDVTERKQQEAQRERLLVESVRDYAIYWLTPAGRVASWNAGAERLTGYRTEEILGEHFSRFYPSEDSWQGRPEMLLRLAGQEGRVEDEGWQVCKEGALFWAYGVITALRDEDLQVRGFARATCDMTERKRSEDQLRHATSELARLVDAQREVIDSLQHLRKGREAVQRARLLGDERQRIARELQDQVEQAFFAIGLVTASAATGRPGCRQCGELADSLKQVDDLARAGSEHLHQASFAIDHAEVAGRGLVPALWKLIDDFRQRTHVDADLVLTGPAQRLPTVVAETLYSAASEALTNVERHSRALAVVLGLRICPRSVTLSIQDDGPLSTSIEPDCTRSSIRFGLRSVGERVRDLHGSFAAGPSPEGGFLVRTRLPLDHTSST